MGLCRRPQRYSDATTRRMMAINDQIMILVMGPRQREDPEEIRLGLTVEVELLMIPVAGISL